jgi:hypothetical protein
MDGLCGRSRASNKTESGTGAKQRGHVMTSTPHREWKNDFIQISCYCEQEGGELL